MKHAAWLTVALLLTVGAPAHAVITNVDEADDICAPADDPCIIDEEVVINSGSVIDFGDRAVEMTTGGQLNSGPGDVTLRCGSFSAAVGETVPAIKARSAGGGGGVFSLSARRQCSNGSGTFCFSDGGCKFGTCTAHVCSLEPTRSCTSDASCNLGVCGGNGRCTGNTRKTCTESADCQVGPCELGTDVCSSNLARQCNVDGDCDDGLCTIGDGTISIDGRIAAQGSSNGPPGAIFLTAAGDIETFNLINLNADTRDDDGGIIDIESGLGSVTLGGKVDALAGRDSTGGEVALTAQVDVFVNDVINVNGGDFDGGTVEVDAGRDAFINADVFGNSTSGEGFGGDFTFSAGRDLEVAGGVLIATNGHQNSEVSCGDAGPQAYDAFGDITIGLGAKLESNGPGPDCAGEELALDAGGDVTVAGEFQSKSAGINGSGGIVDVLADGEIDFLPTSVIDVTGGNFGGGSVELAAGGDLTFNGSADGTAGNGGSADGISLDSLNDISIGGSLVLGGVVPAGNINGIISVTGCRVTVENGASLENNGNDGQNQFVGRERIRVELGSQVTADAATGLNSFTYRSAAKPPVLSGTVSPTGVTTLNENLLGCPVCGNGEVDGGESCDDGNTSSGDGCSDTCQDEGCIADTPGYPETALCDDGLGCTDDSCNMATGSCDHIFNCNDGINCTADSCDGETGECKHVPNNALCSDGEGCTTDICNVNDGCFNINNQNACNDGLDCTVSDVCDQGVCAGTPDCPGDEFCDIETGQCMGGTSTTVPVSTTLIGPGFCGDAILDTDLGEQCDDGDTSWDTGEFCDPTCLMLGCGDPDNSGTVVATDALIALNAAVQLASCDACVCNVDNSVGGSPVTATDALRILNAAVGANIDLICPACF